MVQVCIKENDPGFQNIEIDRKMVQVVKSSVTKKLHCEGACTLPALFPLKIKLIDTLYLVEI